MQEFFYPSYIVNTIDEVLKYQSMWVNKVILITTGPSLATFLVSVYLDKMYYVLLMWLCTMKKNFFTLFFDMF